MSYNVGTLWIIYVVVVVLTFLILWGLFSQSMRNIGVTMAFCVATLLGAIAVFIGAFWLDPNTMSSGDKTWLAVLLVVAFILPIFVILIIIWTGRYGMKDTCDCKPMKCIDKCVKKCQRPDGQCAKKWQ